MRVLLPAPFLPINACTRPGRTEKLTPPSAKVGPNALRTSRVRRRGGFVGTPGPSDVPWPFMMVLEPKASGGSTDDTKSE